MPVNDVQRRRRFEALVLPHLPAAYNLARWITSNGADAEDVVQEAFLRAFRFFDSYRDGDARAWLLKIVRNTAHTWLKTNHPSGRVAMEPELLDSLPSVDGRWSPTGDGTSDPAAMAASAADVQRLRTAIAELPVDFREVLVLREFEELSYRAIAEVAGIPIGTVMSRLSRARDQLATIMRTQDGGMP